MGANISLYMYMVFVLHFCKVAIVCIVKTLDSVCWCVYIDLYVQYQESTGEIVHKTVNFYTQTHKQLQCSHNYDVWVLGYTIQPYLTMCGYLAIQ